jgi:hypothetical protein
MNRRNFTAINQLFISKILRLNIGHSKLFIHLNLKQVQVQLIHAASISISSLANESSSESISVLLNQSAY